MKVTTTKKKTTNTSEEDLTIIQPRKKNHNVKTVSIFMNNLDTQINHSYAKLRKNKQKLISTKKQQTGYDQTMPYLLSVNECSYVHPSLFQSIPSTSLRQSLVKQQDIVLLDNKQVMEYIRLVYDIYSIKDPYNQSKQTDKCHSTNKKIRNYKDQIQKEIGSASTAKNYQVRKSIQLNPFSLTRNQQYVKKQSVFTAKVQAISLHSKDKQRFSECSKSSTYRFENKNVLKIKQKIRIASHRDHTKSSAVTSIPQLFRFCFMCQQPILQCNLLDHENSCEELKQAFHKKYQELLAILDKKIARLINQINNNLLQKPQSKIAQQFTQIKTSVKNWIANIPIDSNGKNHTQGQFSKINSIDVNWRGEFNKIQENISRSVCSSFHLIHKLQWFSKLRENIDKQYLKIQ